MNTPFPVVRLEVEHMKYAILHAFTEHVVSLDADVKAAVEAFCKPERIKEIIGRAVDDTLKACIEEEINNFYRYGAGREAIRQAVSRRLEEQGKYA